MEIHNTDSLMAWKLKGIEGYYQIPRNLHFVCLHCIHREEIRPIGYLGSPRAHLHQYVFDIFLN